MDSYAELLWKRGKRFECIDPERNRNKLYELSVDMLLFGPTITRRWGRIGSRRPRTLSKEYETWGEARREIQGHPQEEGEKGV
jgi:predicted DNA-binding WGR domain protein